MSEKRPYRAHSAEFKAEAVKMVIDGERATEVARKLGLSPSLLATWVGATRGKGRPMVQGDETAEIRVLKRELAKAQMERDILKKAVAFFAKESP